MTRAGVPMVEVCPNCDEPNITERVTKTPAFRCNVCTERFAEPTRRHDKNYVHDAGGAPIDEERYETLLAALRRTRDAGSSHARAKLVAQYSDALDTQEAAQLLSRVAEPRGDVERYRDASLGVIWRITVDDAPSEQEVPA